MHGVCWTLGQNGNSCAETCASVGVKTPDQSTYVSSVMEDLLGSLDNIQIGLVARGPYECLDTGGLNVYNLHDRDESLVPTYEHDTWSHTHCQLACPCAFPDAQPDTPIGIEDVDINADYTEMEQTCASNHMRLCSASEICDWLTSSSNEFLDKWKIEQNVVQNNLEVWVPVNDNQDDWICTSPYGCDAGSTNRCDTPTGSEPAMVVNITERRLVCCGSLYPAPTTTSDQLHIQYATSDDLNSNYNIDESISREPPAYLPRSSALARKDCMSYSFAENNNKPDSCRWTDEQTTYDWFVHTPFTLFVFLEIILQHNIYITHTYTHMLGMDMETMHHIPQNCDLVFTTLQKVLIFSSPTTILRSYQKSTHIFVYINLDIDLRTLERVGPCLRFSVMMMVFLALDRTVTSHSLQIFPVQKVSLRKKLLL